MIKIKHNHCIPFLLKLAACFFLPLLAVAQEVRKEVEKEIEKSNTTYTNWYTHLHAHPELSTKEVQTAAYLKKEMRAMGLKIVDSLGMHNFAAVMKNGDGPVVMYRTDMDALPVKEATGLPFASKASYQQGGETIHAMHACGHDIHMSIWLGTARLLNSIRSQWSGTVVFLAQSAEEFGQGAKAAVAAKNYTLLPKPDVQLALHAHAELPAGKIGFCDGFAMAAVDMLNITIFGKGGHGAAPQQTIDPILLSAQYVNAIQSIVSRNLQPTDAAVITVGAIQGGTAGNIIPDQVQLKLTIRSFGETSRQLILDRLKEIGDNMAKAAGIEKDRLPQYDLLPMSIPAVYNDPMVGNTLRSALQRHTPSYDVGLVQPVMLGEDFGVYGQQKEKIPSYLMWIGTVAAGTVPQHALHTAQFAPQYETTIPKGVGTMTTSILELMNKNGLR